MNHKEKPSDPASVPKRITVNNIKHSFADIDLSRDHNASAPEGDNLLKLVEEISKTQPWHRNAHRRCWKNFH